MTRSLVFLHVVFALFMTLFVTGCASTPGTTPRAVLSQSYDLPATLEANAVIRAVERAFARTLAKSPRIAEGSVPSPLPAKPAPFTIENRQVRLDRLGVVNVPQVNCPESMAVVHALATEAGGSSGLGKYTACIQLYAEGYRIALIAAGMGLERHDRYDGVVGPMESEPKSGAALLLRLAQALREQISEVRPVDEPRASESTGRADRKPATGEQVASLALPVERSAATSSVHREEDAVSTLPLVCLAPRHEAAPVRSARGDGHVITMFDAGSVMAVAEPVDAAYFRVETEAGLAGWVNHADVRRLPCPVG
ncbi:MAG: hypothetical protein P0111_12095 [Nitrospira sp.]|nr:hypothetical protein [Nitrospira sp.]